MQRRTVSSVSQMCRAACAAVVVVTSIFTLGEPTTKTPGAAKPRPILRTFDPNAARVAPERLSDFDALAAALIREGRGEFETQPEFERRLSRQVPTGIYAVRLQNPKWSYDVDAEVLTLNVSTSEVKVGLRLSDYTMLIVRETTMPNRVYTAQNAFGAAMIVRETTIKRHGVLTRMIPEGLALRMNAKAAQALKPAVGLLLVIDVRSDDVITTDREFDEIRPDSRTIGYDHIEPTFEEPKEIHVYYSGFPAETVGFWIYRKTTGEVIARFDTSGTITSGPAPLTLVERLGLRVGMSTEEVVSRLGEPDERTQSYVGSNRYSDWYYHKENAFVRFDIFEKVVTAERP